MEPERISFLPVVLPAPFGMATALGCRRCGAVVAADPPEFADQHRRWHDVLDEIITELDRRR